MKKALTILTLLISTTLVKAQDPAITSWMINTTGLTGSHYVTGNSTPIEDDYPANVQTVQYSDDFVYIECSGIPSYVVGPYQDGNPAMATNNEWLFKIPLNPTPAGVDVNTPMGQIGVFINGVPMYNYADGASWSAGQNGDEMMNGDGVWNRNAILAENDGFDCSKGHPSPIFNGPPGQGALAGGTYHHHQNPSAFNMDLIEMSDVCDLYLSDGLYTIDASTHSPIIGYAFDGYPVYGPYGFANQDGSGGVVRVSSSYQLRDISERTHYADGTDVADGPDVSATYPLGWYKEDFEFIQGSGLLDEYNGRECVTPEYPNGTYAYFATVDENWNSAYPYLVGPSYYGEVEDDNFNTPPNGNSVTINEDVTSYDPNSIAERQLDESQIIAFPNPAADLIAIQMKGINPFDLRIELVDMQGKVVQQTVLKQGSTIWHLDTRTIYAGEYLVKVYGADSLVTKRIQVVK